MRRIILFCILFFSLSIAFADESERITNFDSSVVVNPDASIDVTENISVYANQQQILHGIKRWLPTEYRDSYGINHHINYEIKRILVNSQPSDYHILYDNSALTIFLGNKNWILQPGNYTYTIQYHVGNAIYFLKDADEIYWNITGNNWDFPIMHATATVNLPDNARILQYAGYTGTRGSTGSNYSANQINSHQILFETTETLNQQEGFSVAVDFPKGVVTKPSFSRMMINYFKANKAVFFALEIIVILILYYLISLFFIIKPPEKGTIIPLFEPPLNLSAAAICYIYNKGDNDDVLTAQIIQCATKGMLSIIEDDDGNYSLEKKDFDSSQVSEDDKQFIQNLFGSISAVAPIKNYITSMQLNINKFNINIGSSGNDDKKFIENSLADNVTTIPIDKSSQPRLYLAKKSLLFRLSNAFEKLYFVSNSNYLIPGWILTAITLLAVIVSSQDFVTALFASIWLGLWTIGCYALFLYFILDFQHFISNLTLFNFRHMFNSLFFFIVFAACLVLAIIGFSAEISLATLILLIATIVINIIFYHLLKTPTLQGQQLIDKIEGFKLFFSVTERYRFDQLQPPAKSLELFEKYLPYAIALDVENQWSEQFNDILQTAMKQPGGYSPAWYRSPTGFNALTFTAFTSSFSSAIADASSISSSSSAGSGGGFSGGGGGGGGGGGW